MKRRAPTFENKKRSVIGLLYPGEDKKFSMTGVKDVMSWEGRWERWAGARLWRAT